MKQIKISVRSLVEFILRSGDITTSESGLAEPDAMQEGTRIHKKLQKKMGVSYQAEVPLTITLPAEYDDIAMEFCIEGRADGIFPGEEGQPEIIIDEIKGIYRRLSTISEPVPVHRAQALCYAYIYASRHKLHQIGIRITYCHIPTEEVKYFIEAITMDELEDWFTELIRKYAKWIAWQIKWQNARNLSIRQTEFPFPYRDGQRELVRGVYLSILRQKRLYIQAPTGVGKTISTVFPAVRAMGEGLTEKIFYLTAKTITRTVVEESLHILSESGTLLKSVTLTAKEKICILEKPQCNPETCPRARGHFDRINDAVFDILTQENTILREQILHYAEKHNVCPFEMSLDISTWCDIIIGDYNYVFDPSASLKRFFAADSQNPYTFLVDEAHNLVERAREMYSASLVKEDVLAVKKMTAPYSKKLSGALNGCNRELLALKRECEQLQKYDSIDIEPLVLRLLRLSSALEDFLQNRGDASASQSIPIDAGTRERLLDFYFGLRTFLNTYETLDDKYIIYAHYLDNGSFQIRLQCMDPSGRLNEYLNKGNSAVFFSATLLPVTYYREQLAGREEDYAIYAPSPFSAENRLLLIGRDVSTKYTRRGPVEYRKIADYIRLFIGGRTGNYLAFFPSYQMMSSVKELLQEELENHPENHVNIVTQGNAMTEEEREEFLSHFQDNPNHTTLGLCVLGGIFGEGIDLKQERLIGAVIVGTGLPMVCTENELFREYFDAHKGTGFCYAYQYPGMNKVLQAGGRVIRTASDKGAVLLLDERFLQQDYQKLFPREWKPYEVVNRKNIQKRLQDFWTK